MFEKVQMIIGEQMGMEPEEITENAVFGKDLPADIIDLTEIAMTLEDEFDLEIPEDDLDKWVTVKDIMDTLMENGVSE